MNEAFKWYLTAADNGHVSSMFEVGKMFANGKGTERDDKKAFHWFERAAENGSDSALAQLGIMYYKGSGILADKSKAASLFLKAAEKNNSYAQYRLGYMYLYGKGLEKNGELANQWLSKAADQNETGAIFELGKQYWYGMGIPVNPGKAIVLLQKAGNDGHVIAQRILGYIYADGGPEKGVPLDFEKAVHWFEKAARQNDALGKMGLGLLTLTGKGTPKNEEEGIRLLTQSANMNYPSAMELLGDFYREEKGDKKEAEKWYRRAAETGDKTVIESMKKKGIYPANP